MANAGQGKNSDLDLSQFAQAMNKVHPMLQTVLNKIADAVNQVGKNGGLAAVGFTPAPAPIQSITVKNVGEVYHVAHSDFSKLAKGAHYFTEVGVNDPAFLQPMVIHHGPSRTSAPFTLPTNDDNGDPINYYFRGFSQLPGSKASTPVNFGGTTATAVVGSGTTNMTPLPSNGSGTGSGTGQQGGVGFGAVLERPQGV